MTSWYNEHDPQKAAWLRELIYEGVIASGEVDERSITEVSANDLRGFTQCHFFAGIGVWSYSLRCAGWPDSRPAWTGSCPCPSFSCAGKSAGFDDPRHLWPVWKRLIGECRPATVFGEQVAAAIGFGWLDLVQAELEGEGYALGKAVLGACSVGAPHIRQRLYFCAHAENGDRWSGERTAQAGFGQDGERRRGFASDGITGYRADPNGGLPSNGNLQRSEEQRLLAEDCGTGECEHPSGTGPARFGELGGSREDSEWLRSGSGGTSKPLHSGDPSGERLQEQSGQRGVLCETMGTSERESINRTGATRGFWADCDWWYGRDGKYRPIEPGVFPLAHGAANRVLKLRGYGDAIVAQAAAQFIQAAKEAINDNHNQD